MFYLRDFKNFAEAELDLDRQVTLLVGPNGSGKSNLIEAVELLSFLAAGHRLHEVTDLGRDGALEVRGGLEACASLGRSEFGLGVKAQVELPDPHGTVSLHYDIVVQVRPDPRILRESLKLDGRKIPLFEVVDFADGSTSADNAVRYDNNDRGRNKPQEFVPADRSALSQYARFAQRNRDLPFGLAVIGAVQDLLAAPMICDPIPKMMRGFERRTSNTASQIERTSRQYCSSYGPRGSLLRRTKLVVLRPA